MLSDVPDTDEFDLDSIIAEVSGQAPAKAAEPMPKVSAEPEKPEEPQLDDSILTEEERKMVDDFSKQINLNDTNGILQYGVGTQKKMADFSETALKNVKTKDLGEVGTMISGLVTELKSFDVE